MASRDKHTSLDAKRLAPAIAWAGRGSKPRLRGYSFKQPRVAYGSDNWIYKSPAGWEGSTGQSDRVFGRYVQFQPNTGSIRLSGLHGESAAANPYSAAIALIRIQNGHMVTVPC